MCHQSRIICICGGWVGILVSLGSLRVTLWESWTETGTLLILVPCWQGLLSGLASRADAPTGLLHRTGMWHAGCDHQRQGSALYSLQNSAPSPPPQTLYSKQSFILVFFAWERFFCPEQYFVSFTRSSLMAHNVNNSSTMQEAQVWSLGQEDPLEKEMATHSSILVWKMQWTESLVDYCSWGCTEWDATEAT